MEIEEGLAKKSGLKWISEAFAWSVDFAFYVDKVLNLIDDF